MHRCPSRFDHLPWLVTGLLIASLALAGCSKSDEPAGEVEAPKGVAQAATAEAKAPEAAPPKAEAPAVESPKGDVYGDGVAGAETITIDQLLADPKAYTGKTVQVQGTVTDVCPKRGCWFEMAGDKPGDKLRFKVQDGVMVFPMDAKGKHAVAEGVVSTRTMTLEETRKYLEYQAKEYGKDVDPASVTEPMTVVRLDGKGAVIRSGK